MIDSDGGRPLNLGARIQIIAVFDGPGSVPRCSQNDAFGEALLDRCVASSVEVGLGNMGDQVSDAISGLVSGNTHGQFPVEQRHPGVQALRVDKGLPLRFFVGYHCTAIHLEAGRRVSPMYSWGSAPPPSHSYTDIPASFRLLSARSNAPFRLTLPPPVTSSARLPYWPAISPGRDSKPAAKTRRIG